MNGLCNSINNMSLNVVTIDFNLYMLRRVVVVIAVAIVFLTNN